MTGEALNFTIADLRTSGQRLGLYCAGCNRFRYMNIDRYEDIMVVRDIAQHLICKRCLSREVETRAVSRDGKTGYWPAEYA